MNNKYLIIIALSLCSFLNNTEAQELQPEQQLAINNSVDSILDEYEKFSCLTMNTSSFSQQYANGLLSLFENRGETKVPNDLPINPNKKTLFLNEYIQLVKTDVPSGLDIILKNIVKSVPVKTDNGYAVSISFEKNILGIYKDNIRFDHIAQIEMEITLSETFNKAKLVSVKKVQPNTKPKSPQNLSGRKQVIAGATGVFYSIDASKDADFYSWNMPSAWSGEGNLNTIFIDFGSDATSGNLSVIASNNKGESTPTVLHIDVTGGEPAPVGTTFSQSKWSIAGELGISNANGYFDPSIQGRGWIRYKHLKKGNDYNLTAKAGVGVSQYTYKVLDNAINKAVYTIAIEAPIMIGLSRTIKKIDISVHSGINIFSMFAASDILEKETGIGWISDIEGQYRLPWMNGTMNLIGGLRYNYVPVTKHNLTALGVYGGLAISTDILKELTNTNN